MKAIRYYGIKDVRCEETEKPKPGEKEVLIKVAYAGICGSDLHIFNKQMFIENIPETMGHEFSGIIEEVGSDVTDFRKGDAVTATPIVACGTCAGCVQGYPNTCDGLGFIGEVCPGCFAEYLVMREEDLVRIPENSDLKPQALTEPLGVVLNIFEKAGFDLQALQSESANTDVKSLLILGAGPIGLLSVYIAKQVYGIEKVTVVGRSKYRMHLAKELGADETVTEISGGELYDMVIEAAGKRPTFEQAVSHTTPNGKLMVVSVFEDKFDVDINDIMVRQISMIGCSACQKKHLEAATAFIACHEDDINKLISGEYNPEACKEAFARLTEAEKDAAKILFKL